MAREDWMRNDFGQADYSTDYGYDPSRRAGYRTDETWLGREDYRQADYSSTYRYDPATGRNYRPYEGVERRSFGGVVRDPPAKRRRGPSDRVLWAVIAERLDDERGLDLRDVEVSVLDGEVTLNGTVRHKADKRRVEDAVDIDGVDHVQNNLRVRERTWGIF